MGWLSAPPGLTSPGLAASWLLLPGRDWGFAGGVGAGSEPPRKAKCPGGPRCQLLRAKPGSRMSRQASGASTSCSDLPHWGVLRGFPLSSPRRRPARSAGSVSRVHGWGGSYPFSPAPRSPAESPLLFAVFLPSSSVSRGLALRTVTVLCRRCGLCTSLQLGAARGASRHRPCPKGSALGSCERGGRCGSPPGFLNCGPRPCACPLVLPPGPLPPAPGPGQGWGAAGGHWRGDLSGLLVTQLRCGLSSSHAKGV